MAYRIRELTRGPAHELTAETAIVCHCERVPDTKVEKAIRRGAHSIVDLQHNFDLSRAGHRGLLPVLEFDQSAFVSLHEHGPAIAQGAKAGSVRLAPADHAVPGWMVRHDPEAQLWRAQHL